MTSTLRYTTVSTTPQQRANLAAMHAVADAALRFIDRADAAVYADQVLATLTAEGCDRVGFKVCHDSGWKQREIHSIHSAECRDLIIRTYGMDAEVWGLKPDGTYSDECF